MNLAIGMLRTAVTSISVLQLATSTAETSLHGFPRVQVGAVGRWDGANILHNSGLTDPDTTSLAWDRLAGLVVKVSSSGAGDPGFESSLCRDFSGWSHTSDLKIGTPVATLPGA